MPLARRSARHSHGSSRTAAPQLAARMRASQLASSGAVGAVLVAGLWVTESLLPRLDTTPAVCPAASSTEAINMAVVVFPAEPATPMVVNSRLGCPAKAWQTRAKAT